MRPVGDFNEIMAQACALMPGGEEDNSDFVASVSELARALGEPRSCTAYAVYCAASAGVPRAEILSLVETAALLVLAGAATRTDTAIDAIVSVVHAHKMNFRYAGKAANSIAQLSNRGLDNRRLVEFLCRAGVEDRDLDETVALAREHGLPSPPRPGGFGLSGLGGFERLYADTADKEQNDQ